MGTLLQQIEKVNKENIEEDTDGDNSDNNDDVRMSFSYDIAIVSQILISLKKILVKLFLNEIIYNTPSWPTISLFNVPETIDEAIKKP